MKLILENWRRQCGEYDFDILCENFDRGLITEIELYETWDRQVMVEMQTLLDEGVMDILKIGYEKGKALAGKAKEAYDTAVAKVAEFFLNLCLQAWNLIQKGKVVLEKIAATLMKGVNFIKKFCNAHPILCKIALILIIMLAISAAMAMMASSASAAVKTQEFGELSDRGVTARKGLIGTAVEGNPDDPVLQREAVKALEWLDKAHQATEQVDLTTATAEGTELLRKASAYVAKMGKKYAETGEAVEFVDQLVAFGEKVRIVTHKMMTTGGVKVRRFVSAEPLPRFDPATGSWSGTMVKQLQQLPK